jgi:hypothetical protein
MLIRKGVRLQAGANARVRELATMTAAEPEKGLIFRHNAPLVAFFEHPLLSTGEVATIKSIARAR